MKNSKKNLIKIGFAYVGMINEAKIKCILCQQKIKTVSTSSEISQEFIQTVKNQIVQIENDLSKYICKLKKICKELEGHEGIFKLE